MSQTAKLEAFTRSSTVHRFDIPAGGTFPISQYGQTFYILKCTAPVEVRTDRTPEKPYRKGTGEEFVEELRFSRLEFRNINSFVVRLEVWVGFGRYIDNRFEVLDSYTGITCALPSELLGALTTLTLTGAPSQNQIQRKAIVVSNLDTGNVLRIWDENDELCCLVFPESSVTLPVSGIVKVRNDTGLAISCAVSEIWYYENQA
jgi:hypothetical protein